MNHNIELYAYKYLTKQNFPKSLRKEDYEIMFQIARELLLSGILLKYNEFDNCDLKDKLRKLNKINILKNLHHLAVLDQIKAKFSENKIPFFLLKGSALEKTNIFKHNERHYRDIDILVSPKNLEKSYMTLKQIGFKYFNNESADLAKYLYKKHHLPPMINNDGVIVEIHHRATKEKYLKECFITKNIVNNAVEIDGFFVPNKKDLIVHAAYHGLLHHSPNHPPNFLYDIYILLNGDVKMLNQAKHDFLLLKLDTKFNLMKEIFEKAFSNALDINEMTYLVDKLGLSISKNYIETTNNVMCFKKKKDKFSFKKIITYLQDISYYYQVSFLSIRFFKLLIIKFFKNTYHLCYGSKK